MVEFETQVYYKDGGSIVGAEVIVIGEAGEPISSLKITSQTEYDNLVSQLNNLSSNFVSFSENSAISGMSIEEILANTADTVNINAVTLGGLQSDRYSKIDHIHDNRYYTEGEVDAKLNGKANSNHSHGWTNQQCTNYGRLYINSALRLCEFYYHRENYKYEDSGEEYSLHTGAIPNGYRPLFHKITTGWNPSVTLAVTPGGDIKTRATSQGTKQINCSVMWHY